MREKKTYQKLILIILLVSCISSCHKTDSPIPEDDETILVPKQDTLKNYSPEIRFEVTGRLLEGKRIDCIEPDYKGNTWVASGQELFHFRNKQPEQTYTFDFAIKDISIAGDESLWIGTNGGGLGHITKDGITWYTKENSGLPRDYIANVEVGLDGRVWFSSGAHDYGGLLVYNGKKFDLFTPDNSILNQHVIGDMAIDHYGSLYVMTLSKVTRSNIYRITGNSWECLGNQNGTFYWIWVFTVSPTSTLYLLEDFGLSSTLTDSNKLYIYRNSEWTRLKPDFMTSRYYIFTALKADRRSYCWAVSIEGNSYVLRVYDGSDWINAPENLLKDEKITVIETDFDNNIWIGTADNGIFILKQ